MKIQKLHLIKYKRFFDLSINLGDTPKRIVALVGPNGCGKSSIFDAMLFHSSAYVRLGNGTRPNYMYHSLDSSPGYDYRNVEILFDEGSFDRVFNSLNGSGMGQTIFSFRSCFRYNGELLVRESKAVSELRENNFGASFSVDIDQRIDQNYRRLHIKYNNYLNKQDCKPSEAKRHIIGELNAALTECLDLEIDSLGDIEAGKGTFYFRKPDTPHPFEYNVLSAGEKEVVDILLDLYLRKDVYKDSIYIIDEPELHLNTAIQKKLLLEINKMVPPNCQIWVATHSIGFLRALQDELCSESAIIEFNAENHWAEKPYVLQPMIKCRTNWMRVFSVALEDLTGLVSPQRIIYCEGRDQPTHSKEEQGFDAKVFNSIFGEMHPDTLFVSSGGNTELDQRSDIAISILTKVFHDIEIWVLKDRDMASGRPTNEADRQLYLQSNPRNHRVLKRWEIENYLFDKEVLKAYCGKNNLQFNEPQYDAFVTDIVNKNIKDDVGRMKNYCGITVSINAEQFKLNLAKVIDSSMTVYHELEQEIFSRQ